VHAHGISSQIDDPEFTNPALCVNLSLRPAIGFKAAVGDLDQQKNVRGTRMSIRVVGPPALYHRNIRLRFRAAAAEPDDGSG
jgi:hypothetical protein